MSGQEVVAEQVQVDVENVGGIERTEVSFNPGVTLLAGRNATNRTSFLQAIMAGLGSTRVSLKADADHGSVTLQIGDSEYTRELTRQNGEIAFSGDPYLDDPELADLFAFLLESNEARRTVARGDDLRDIIMRPVDADAIQAEIRQLTSERDDIEAKIEEREALKDKLPNLEEQRTTIEEKIQEKRTELEQKREELDERSTDGEDAQAEQTELEEKIQTLQSKQDELDTTEYRLDSERESLDSLQTELDELQDEYESLTEDEPGDLDHIESEIARLRETKQHFETELSKLQNVIQFNEEMLEGTSQDIAAALRDEESDEAGAVTDQLLDDQGELVCWTCGTAVDEETIEATIDRLRDLRQSKYSEQRDVEDELADLKERKSSIEATRQKRTDLEERIADINAEIDEREEKIDSLESEREELQADIAELEADIEELEQNDRSEVLDVRREVNELELGLERLKDKRDRIAEEIADIEGQLAEIDTLEERRAAITDQLEELRTRIDRIESEAIEAFNEHMETVLDILEYENLDRIWVERVEQEVREGRRTVTQAEFRLHVVRSTEEGITYEDEFAHLSESEREVTGLVFALAGYLVHDVYEEVPFILMDSLEAIDADRIATLVDYMREYADYLVVALLPEDAAALDEEYDRISDI